MGPGGALLDSQVSGREADVWMGRTCTGVEGLRCWDHAHGLLLNSITVAVLRAAFCPVPAE